MTNKLQRNLIVSLLVGIAGGFLLFQDNLISGYTISANPIFTESIKSLASNIFFIFISCFLVLETLGFGKNLIQQRLGEMEKNQPSSDNSRRSRGLASIIKDKYILATRKATKQKQDETRHVASPNYEGFPELYSPDTSPQFKELDSATKEIVFNSTKNSWRIGDSKQRQEVVSQSLNDIQKFESTFPREDLEEILKRSSGKPLYEIEHSIGKILGRKIYAVGGINSPRQLLAVHMTDYFPENAKITTSGNATYNRHDLKDKKASVPLNTRQTVSFSLNHTVAPNLGAAGTNDWSDKRYAILLPVESIIDKELVNLSATDSFAFGDVSLRNKGAEIVVSKRAYNTMSAREIESLKRRSGAEVVTYQQEGEKTLSDTVKRRIMERGYDTLHPGFYDEFRNQIDAHFKEDIQKLADKYGKVSTMHAWTPSGRVEERMASIIYSGWNTTNVHGNPLDHRNYIDTDMKQYEGDIERARGGKMTPKDTATFKKLKGTINNARKRDVA